MNIFLSYISEEGKLANFLKSELEKLSPEIKIFSYSHDIEIGTEWERKIKENLENCDLLMILISPLSIERRWLTLEFGAFWAANKKIFVLTHSNIRPADLYYPLNKYYCVQLSTYEGVIKLINSIQELAKINELPSYFQVPIFVNRLTDVLEQLYKTNFISLDTLEDINTVCRLSIKMLTPIEIKPEKIISISDNLKNLDIISSGKTLLFNNSLIEDAGTIKINLNKLLKDKKYLILKIENSFKSKSNSNYKLVKIVAGFPTQKYYTTKVLKPVLESHQNFDDKEYIFMADGYFVYDVAGLFVDQIEFVFWKIHLVDLKISLFSAS